MLVLPHGEITSSQAGSYVVATLTTISIHLQRLASTA